MFRKTIKLVLILLFFSCKSENKLDTQTSSPKLILSEIIKSDSLNIIKFSSKSLKMIADWTPLISINSKINKISIHSNDHVSIINSIKIDLEEIPTSSAIKYKVRVKPEVARAFKSMVTAASNDSVVVGSVSGFRSYKQQADARSRKPNLAVRPGFSRHQEGIAIDIDVQTTPRTYQWLAENAHKYGFARTVSYEPWHWVYFGIEEATKRRPAYTDVSGG